MRIYIASPYCPIGVSLHDAPRVANKHVETAIAVAHQLIAKGHYPFVPLLSHYIQISATAPKDYGAWWYIYDLSFLDYWAEAILILGKSKGCLIEEEFAKRKGLKLYYRIEDIPEGDEVRA